MASDGNAIAKLSIRHEAIMHFLMANPTVKLGDVADHFGMTQAWLSSVIHSDAFQAKLKENTNIAFHTTVLPIREKMTLLAHQALDQVMDRLPMETDVKTISGVASDVLDRLGFGTKSSAIAPQGTQVNVQVNVLRSELEEARAMLGKPQVNLLEGAMNGIRAALPVSGENSAGVGDATAPSTKLRELEADLG
jgi:hypothetical protein